MDKINFIEKSNIMLDKRTFEFANKSVILDNNKLLEQLNNNKINNNTFNYNKNIGEITGQLLNISDIDKGMPFRSESGNTFKKRIMENNEYNRHLDFDVYDEDKQVNLDVLYYDPNNTKICLLDEIDKDIIIENNELDQVKYIINDFNWYLFDNITNLINKNFFFTSLGIMNLMSILYIASTGKSEIIFKNYFNYSNKQTILNGIMILNETINSSQCLDLQNYILVRNNIDININFKDYIKNIVSIINIQNDNYKIETQKINNFIKKKYGILGDIFKINHIKDLTITCLCLGILRTVWKVSFDKIIKLKFNNLHVKEFMYNKNKSYEYFENTNIQLIEIPFYDNVLSMGIILFKENSITLSMNDFTYYINNLKSVNINEIAIPIFNHHCKMRLNTIFKKTGLEEIFDNVEIPELIKHKTKISDIILNIYLIVENKYNKSNYDNVNNYNNVNNNNNNLNFIANKPFIYYFRCIKTNTIIITGQYS